MTNEVNIGDGYRFGPHLVRVNEEVERPDHRGRSYECTVMDSIWDRDYIGRQIILTAQQCVELVDDVAQFRRVALRDEPIPHPRVPKLIESWANYLQNA
jgi:hypothetical protein